MLQAFRRMAVLCRRDDLAQPSSPTAGLAQVLFCYVPQGSEGAAAALIS